LILIALFFLWIGSGSGTRNKHTEERRALISQIEMYINTGEIEQAKKEIPHVDSYYREELLEKLQFAELNNELNKIDSLIENKNFEKASSALKKLVWTPVSSYISSREKELIKSFLRKKEIANSSLPSKYRIKVEGIDEYVKQEDK
jgi:hypothetical protein